ncbi:MAG: hypothetical protein BGO70_01200 [Bacteroidetes bacterium 43-93]|nr:MAG: hypothetical protein BGO70_01200 [Bacteroidetes bacterium 43-93]
MGSVLTASGDGTVINSVTIKATGNTQQGMVRLFIDNGVNKFLLVEVMIPASVQTSVEPAFGIELTGPIKLTANYVLYASTEQSDSFVVTATGVIWENCTC